jgi:hypothetical protein
LIDRELEHEHEIDMPPRRPSDFAVQRGLAEVATLIACQTAALLQLAKAVRAADSQSELSQTVENELRQLSGTQERVLLALEGRQG